MRISILGAPSSAGANIPGLEGGPAHLRRCGLREELSAAGFEVLDEGDCDCTTFRPDAVQPDARNLELTVQAARQVRNRVLDFYEPDSGKLLLLGGDCTLTVGLVGAFLDLVPGLGLAYLDAQTDLNTPATTNTGILDSMGLAHILGLADNGLAEQGSVEGEVLPPERVVAFGFHPDRISPAERALVDTLPLSAYPVTMVHEDVDLFAGEALGVLESRCEAFVLHFDVDIIDFAAFPIADAPVYRGFGLGLEAAMKALGMFAASEKCAAIALTEFNPDRDKDGAYGRQFARRFAHALTGHA